ncbi:hypothetical protein [Taibaiella koreensis]|uniref:hypothetical protein n=1 Tax=Taibaiella koreensis TaxID=1268548 RepID=UPI0013C2AD65|nr:hypothetical protein [Taibaiella koreensis]
MQKILFHPLTSYYHQPLLPHFRELSGYLRNYAGQMETVVDQRDTIYLVHKSQERAEPQLFAALQMVGYHLCLNVNPDKVRTILNGPGYPCLKQVYNGKGQFRFRKVRPQCYPELQSLFQALSN